MNQCAPNVSDNSFTCFTYQQLKSIAKKFNQTSDEKIKISRKKDVLWKKIYEKMKYKCNDELCWVNNDKLMQRFRPKRPNEWHSNPREWLSNFDIQKVMVQYEKKYKTFKFLGVFPDDYDHKIFMNTCVAEELCKLDVAELLKDNKYQLGMVFNTDPHYLGGSHWVAIYANINESLDKYGFYYYDSNAQKPSKYIIKLFNQIKAQLKTKTKAGICKRRVRRDERRERDTTPDEAGNRGGMRGIENREDEFSEDIFYKQQQKQKKGCCLRAEHQ